MPSCRGGRRWMRASWTLLTLVGCLRRVAPIATDEVHAGTRSAGRRIRAGHRRRALVRGQIAVDVALTRAGAGDIAARARRAVAARAVRSALAGAAGDISARR